MPRCVIYVLVMRSSLSFFNLDIFQNSTSERPCNPTFSLLASFPVLTTRSSDDEPVSPTQTVLLKLLDSFLNSVPTPFRDQDDHRNNLAGFLASAFLLQAEHAQQAIQQATGELSPSQNVATDVRGGGGTPTGAASCALDGRLPGVWVAFVLLSTCLSSILLAEHEDCSGVCTDPGGVTSSHVCHDTISASRTRAGSGFIEELLGMMVPWFLPLVETIIRPRVPAFTPQFSPTYQFWEGQVIPGRQGRRS
jgi:hypothetical protein